MKRKLTDLERCGAEQFYSYLQSKLAAIETKSVLISDIIVDVRAFARDNFITFLKDGAK